MKQPQTNYKPNPRPVVGGSQVAENSRKSSVTGIDLVWVQCKGYRCMAYSDATGRWINFYTGKVLADVVELQR